MEKLTRLVITAAAALVACDDPSQPSSVGALTASIEPEAVATQVITGPIGPGAIYSLHRPANWNGDLVLFAHGAVPPTIPLRLPPVPVRDSLLARGYAFAYSSRSETGLAIKDGVQRTRQLRGLFVSAFGHPAHTYMIGNSLGGEIALMLAETNPELLDGALLISAPVGGSLMEFNYVFNVRVLYEYFFPGAIPGDALHVPRDLNFDPAIAAAVASSLQSDAARARELAGIDQIDVQYATFAELVNAIVGALRAHWNFTNDILDRTQGHSFFDNTATRYTGSSDDAALNAGVGRFASTVDAENHWEHYYQPDGRLTVPLLTLHGTRDFFVPLLHEATYAALVASQGASDRVVQRTFDRFGHGMFTIPEQLRAFDELVRWVETGSRPSP